MSDKKWKPQIVGFACNWCTYAGADLAGTFKAQARVALAKRLLAQFGIEPERLYLEWISAGEGTKFADVIVQFTERVRELGPNPTHLELG